LIIQFFWLFCWFVIVDNLVKAALQECLLQIWCGEYGMPKINKFDRDVASKLRLTRDPDILQVMDEQDSIWVEAWNIAAKKSFALTLQVVPRLNRMKV
jgi:hypothetical protein